MCTVADLQLILGEGKGLESPLDQNASLWVVQKAVAGHLVAGSLTLQMIQILY